MSEPATPPTSLLVACLCAAWCRVCESYQQEFAQLAQRYPQVRFRWVDVEDEAALVDDLDVETFPTLLIGRGEHLAFAGPVPPQLGSAERLISAALDGGGQPGTDPAAQALLRRLQAGG